MRRREFITLLGGAAAWPVAARAQQAAMPVIGFLSTTSPEPNADIVHAFRRGLKDTGYVEGENIAIEYRWADNQIDRLPGLAAELVHRRVAAIVTGSPAPAFAAKEATTTIPIVFMVAGDPVRLGLVASLARPGGNLTGINFFTFEVAAKRLELLRELVPRAARVALLINPANAAIAKSTLRDVEGAARTIGVQLQVLRADTIHEIDAAFDTFVRERPDALFISSSPFFTPRRFQLAQLAARHAVPATYGNRQYAEAGGLMSYGTSVTDAYPSGWRLHRPHPQGHETGRLAGQAVDQVRTGH